MTTKAKIIDGKSIANDIQNEVAEQITNLKLTPGLGVILVGNDPASELYVSLKQKAANKVGINFCLYKFDEDAKESEILETINWLNKDDEIHAILVQLPLPKHLDEDVIIQAINSKKDVDGFHPQNIKAYLNNEPTIAPGLSMGIIQLITSTGENLKDKTALIIAKSEEFTKPLEHTLSAFGVQSQSIQPNDPTLRDVMPTFDIIITAIGKPKWIMADFIKEKAILIDVGTTKLNNETVGDVDFESCKLKASWITPVPGGVGPMTVAMLLKNTVALARQPIEQA
ncbi:bifunctional methylenetetrahydrofolate dehydrogenase/methenyltetrahydrofolate cyclohydrolase [bacterium]|jgi:methylenetetrahydrofolate dehydrogenase (NADP+)/methenyltetrahydrofolate cyclohydrolase|nr:bifunctional methylenetetrahydrofolate dehydrogenase/methenyltetrahydrofolate cyclohydrolase [bacterium]MDP6571529.1 tetrahydrofolate dehydrogenase/cyclohydrolase catalytic domain-containing protein [Patescibacteria group bacterium]MDP6756522.1 tetrahydrofolate dehydrogenase/cyclohydrolase catalytic domain-containing protein [Patescibacteria group bacterium]|tara:strand:- start:21341 stop:22192 length:852 start_codon:yes stop_codon:yes gene_type:complete